MKDKKKEFRFSIDDEDLGHIFSILRNKTYSNKPLAVIREYSTNAADANRDNNLINHPIEVSLPEKDNGFVFSVRDFGTGLSASDVENIYCKYGKSTKRENVKANGQLGIGSKAAFAYADEFFITSFCNGTMSKYRAFIDDSGRGKITSLESEESAEPSGVLIEVPCDEKDECVFEGIARAFYRHFVPKPLFKNKNKVEISSFNYYLLGSTWGIILSPGEKSKIIMSNVAYDLDLEEAIGRANLFQSRYVYASQPLHIHIYAEPGEVDFSSSRETIEYTEKTKAFLKDKVGQIEKEALLSLQSKMHLCPDLLSAAYEIDEIPNPLSRLFINTITYRGVCPRAEMDDVDRLFHQHQAKHITFMQLHDGKCNYDKKHSRPKISQCKKIYYTTKRRGYVRRMSQVCSLTNTQEHLIIAPNHDFINLLLTKTMVARDRIVCIDDIKVKPADAKPKSEGTVKLYRFPRYGSGLISGSSFSGQSATISLSSPDPVYYLPYSHGQYSDDKVGQITAMHQFCHFAETLKGICLEYLDTKIDTMYAVSYTAENTIKRKGNGNFINLARYVYEASSGLAMKKEHTSAILHSLVKRCRAVTMASAIINSRGLDNCGINDEELVEAAKTSAYMESCYAQSPLARSTYLTSIFKEEKESLEERRCDMHEKMLELSKTYGFIDEYVSVPTSISQEGIDDLISVMNFFYEKNKKS